MREGKRIEAELADIAMSSTVAESMAYNEEKRMRKMGKYLRALYMMEPVVTATPHPMTTMSDAEIRALGNDVY